MENTISRGKKKKKKKKKRRSVVESEETNTVVESTQPTNVSFGKPPLQPKKLVVEEVLEQTQSDASS